MNEENYNNGMSPQAAEFKPDMAAKPSASRKLSGDEFLQRKLEEAMSPPAADIDSLIKAANSDEEMHRS